MTSQTATRRRVIRKLILDGNVVSQHQIVEALATEGMHVTQATVSRDLGAIGAVKVRGAGGETHYEIDDHDRFAPGDAHQRLTQSFTQFVESIGHSDNLVVIHTAPGAAHLVASGIDGAGVDGVLGTVAGDDTIFVAATSDVGGAELQQRFESIGAG